MKKNLSFFGHVWTEERQQIEKTKKLIICGINTQKMKMTQIDHCFVVF